MTSELLYLPLLLTWESPWHQRLQIAQILTALYEVFTEVRVMVNFSAKGMCEACDVCTSIHHSCVAHFVQGQVSKLQVWWIGVGAYQRYKQSIPCAVLCSLNLASSSNALQRLTFHLLPTNILKQFKIHSNKCIEDRICNLSAKLSWKEHQLSTNLFNNI